MSKPVNADATLAPTLSQNIRAQCAAGYQLYDQGQYDRAVRAFYQAWLLLPKPQTQYHEAGWVLTALSDGYFRAGRLPQALEAANSALCCPGADKNLAVQLRMGQALLDSGDTAAARKVLFRVFQKAGTGAFAGEDPRYLHAIDDLTGEA